MSFARRSLQVVAFLCTLIVGVTSMAVIVTQTTWFKEWLRGFIVRQAEDYVNGRLEIGRLDGNLFFGVELEDIDVTMNGKKVVDIADVGLDYNAFTFISGGVVLDHIRLNKPQLLLERTADGWNLTNLIKARTPRDPNQARRPIEIGEIGISEGAVAIEGGPVGTSGFAMPSKVEKLDASIGVKSNEDELRVEIAHVSLRAVGPGLGINALSGVIRRSKQDLAFENVSLRTEESSVRVEGTIKRIEGSTPVLSLRVSSDKLAVDEIAKVVPALRGYLLQPAFEITATGPTDRLSVAVNAREATLGSVVGDLTVDAEGPGRRVAGTLSMRHFNFGPLVRRRGRETSQPPLGSDITGEARIDLALPSDGRPLAGTYALNAGSVQVAGYEARNVVANGRLDGRRISVNARAAAYGGTATAAGTVRAGQPLALDLKGQASGLDLRNLPARLRVPSVPSHLDLAYSLTGRGPVFAGEVRFEPSTVAGATIARGTTAQFRVGDGAPSYSSTGQVSNLDVQQIGRGFTIAALEADRFSSRINATYDVKGSGGGSYPLTLDATGTLVDSTMFGASVPKLDFTTSFADGDMRVKANGQFANLDPSIPSGNERLAGMLTGSLNVETAIEHYAEGVTIDAIDASGRIDLTQSTIADLSIDSAVVDGQFANREGTINELSIAGSDITLTGKGPIALNETGASNVALHLETSSLERIGRIIGRPLTGGAVIDGAVNGNAKELVIYGTLTGSNIGYGEHGALAANSNFDVTIPDLNGGNAAIHANTSATFVKVGGQELNALTADTTFFKSNLIFSTTARQGERQLDAGGNVVFHTDHQEIHLPSLSLRTQGVEWRTAPGAEAAIQYGSERIGVEHVELVSGMQRLTANGALGSAGETLQVRVENVDVSQLTQLMLRDPKQVGGLLNATATISGPRTAPRVASEFTLAPGVFQTFTFESLGGKVDYSETGLELDVRLQQSPTAWFTAKGHAPLTLFSATPPEMAGAHRAANERERVDLQISSSAINLAVIQGFTSYVTNVTGTLQANVTVTGSGYDPHLDGVIDIKGGAFALPDLGTAYTGLDTRIELQPDTIRIREMKIVDNHGSPLTIGGELGVHGRDVGGVNVTMRSDDFKVIDNALGNVRVDTDVRLTGELRRPRVEGRVDVATGLLDVARLLERFTNDAYATEATPLPVSAPEAAATVAADAAATVRKNVEIAPDADARVPNAGADTAPNARAATDKAEADGVKAALRPDEGPAEARDEAEESTTVFQALELDLTVGVPDDLVLRGRDIRAGGAGVSLGDASITVGGDVQIRKKAGDTLRLLGEVRTVRGTYTFQGRRFEIMRDGRIRFIGADEINPTLDLEARRVISGVEAFIRIRGDMRQPVLSFRSNPPLDEADVLSLIVFNQPINELGEGQQVSLAQRAGDLAAGFLASGLTRSIGDALNLSEFEISASGDDGLGPSVTLGQQVGRDLFFRVRQGFGNAQATEFILEYQLAEFLRLQATAAEGAGGNQRVQFRRVERGGLDLIFFFAY